MVWESEGNVSGLGVTDIGYTHSCDLIVPEALLQTDLVDTTSWDGGVLPHLVHDGHPRSRAKLVAHGYAFSSPRAQQQAKS